MRLASGSTSRLVLFPLGILVTCLLAPPGARAADQTKHLHFDPAAGGEPLGRGIFMHRAARPDDTEVVVYSNRAQLHRGPARPALVIAPGTGCSSLFRRRRRGLPCRGIPCRFVLAAKGYTVLLMEKRGVRPLVAGRGRGRHQLCSGEYIRTANREDRIRELKLLVGALVDLEAVDTKRVVLVGYSEGGSVAAGTASEPVVTHLGLFGGGGPTHMFDMLVHLRRRLRGNPPAVVEKRVARLMEKFRDVLRHPDSLDRRFQGHPYRRWAGFFRYAVVDALLALDIPIYMAHASRDQVVPIHSADFVELEFIRRGKDNLTVRRYPGVGHNFAREIPRLACEQAPDEEAGAAGAAAAGPEGDDLPMAHQAAKELPEDDGARPKMVSRMRRVIRDFLDWVEQTAS